MKHDDPQNPGGWAPLPPISANRGPSLEEEERAMRSGRGRMLVFASSIVVAALGGLVYYLANAGPSAHRMVSRQVNGMRAENFDSFWACALPRADPRDIRNNEQLTAAIHERARFDPSGYAQLVRSQCMAHLNDHVQPLDALLPPDEMRESVEALRAALRSLIDGWNAFLAHLGSLTGPYDPESDEASRLVTSIARGWFDYKIAVGRINEIAREHGD